MNGYIVSIYEKSLIASSTEYYLKLLSLVELPTHNGNLLKALYSSQVTSVQGSKYFEISRGVKQGDIISPMLFNCALDVARTKWKQKLSTHGWKIDEQYLRLTYMRYADDIILYAKSKDELRSMLELFVTELSHIGLTLNEDKTKILTCSHIDQPDNISVHGMPIEILSQTKAHKYLGRLISLNPTDRISKEVKARMRAAWSTFHQYRKCLCNHAISLKLRLRLFDACISPVALFGLGILPLSKKVRNDFDIIQRKMLRSIIGWRIKSSDTYEDTMRRMKERFNMASSLYKVQSWDTRILKQQISYLVHLSTLPATHPARRLLSWNPMNIVDPSSSNIAYRSVGRPKMK